jgi:hypothetical protein
MIELVCIRIVDMNYKLPKAFLKGSENMRMVLLCPVS